MKSSIFSILLLCSVSSIFAQRTFTETWPANGINNIKITTEFASMEVETWDKNEIQIEGYISIYNDEANDAFEWTVDQKGSTFYFESETNFPKWNKNAKWDNCNQTSDIRLKIKVPKNRKLITRATYGGVTVAGLEHTADIKSTYGGVDVQLSRLPKEELRIESTYGHVDIAVAASARASLTLKTPFGETLTDLPLEIKGSKQHTVGSTLQAELNGGGIPIYAEAGYNKIYLRKL
ncbi:MAG: hypothetical protein AAGI23_08825 [Bacteroidota bacterium]